jgi:hypothetical protein
MKLKDLSKKPALIEVTLDDEDTLKEYNEPLTFSTWDRVPLDVFTKLASVNQSNLGEVVDIVRLLILDEDGREVMSKDQVLPPHVLIRAIAKIVERLGN